MDRYKRLVKAQEAPAMHQDSEGDSDGDYTSKHEF